MINNFPRYVMIQTTSRCNSHCIFCPYKEVSNELPQGKMEDGLYNKIIDECSSYFGVERILPYLMNEPLMDSGIVEKINYAKEKNPNACIHILTNGSILTDGLSKRLIGSRLDWIGFSVHGIRKDTYENSMKGLLLERTLSNICRFIELAKVSRNSEFIMITFFRYGGLSLEEKEEAIDFWKRRGIQRISYFDGPISRAGNVGEIPHPKHNAVKGCRSIWRDEMIHILYNGDVVLCCMDWRRQVILGNVGNESIYDIWNGPGYRQIRGMVSGEIESEEDFICKHCEEAIVG